MTLVWVGLGGCIGSILRFLLGEYVQGRSGSLFPFGTLAVNVLGCFAIGGLTGLFEGTLLPNPEARAFLVAGFLGGFTTFSAFGNETVLLAGGGHRWLALANVAAQFLLGLGAVGLGRALARTIWK